MMDSGANGFSLARIREIDIVGYLARLGHEPVEVKKNGTDHWYLSPLRNEGEASFHVNQATNEWYDFPLAKGGNLVDFCLIYHGCSIRELLDNFNLDQSHFHLPVFNAALHEGRLDEGPKLRITDVRTLYAYPLKNYLHERSISFAIAHQFCKEVAYEISGRTYYGIGFKNDSGGYEIRNKNYKQSSSPKDITTLISNAPQVKVFEGFMDFLSYRTLQPEIEPDRCDFIILNGAGMFERALPVMQNYERVGLLLDQDVTGRAYTQYALSLGSRFRDDSGFYSKFKDLNDWLVYKGEVPKPMIRPARRLIKGSS